MSREKEHPQIEWKEDGHREYTESHPAFAQISAARVQSTGKLLYGSDFAHNSIVMIRIHRSEMDRGLSSDWFHEREEYIEVALSEAQWAGFVSRLNQGSGVPCTLMRKDNQFAPAIASLTNKAQQFKHEMADCLKTAEKELAKLKQLIEGNGKKSEIRNALIQLENHLSPNVTFVVQQFGKHIEDRTEKAKSEIGAYIESHIRRAGIKALQGTTPIKEIEDEKGKAE